MKKQYFLAAVSACLLVACNYSKASKEKSGPFVRQDTSSTALPVMQAGTVADAAKILARRQVPVLCYHHIRELNPGQTAVSHPYSVTPAIFAEQMKALKDSGYQTILPNQLYDYLVHDGTLPPRPVMLTFDDTDEEQFSIAYQEMKKYGFKGVFFIMTVSINRPRYMTREQIRELADDGNAVESHTWDHQMVTKYQGNDWDKQFVRPRKTIEEITGKPAGYFAYPFGVWNPAAIPELKKANFKMAFILSTRRDSTEPLYTTRRMIVPGNWSGHGMVQAMKRTFKL
jgi:peptidoglycan/xylan/chitin deacetylase (PgdA/CDA1 family)